MRYGNKILDAFAQDDYIGTFEDSDNNINIGTGLVGAPACGDVLKLQIKVNKDNNLEIIEDARILIFGCVSAKAASIYTVKMMIGKTLEEAKTIRDKEIANNLDLPKIKLHCSVLAQEAIEAAIKNYYDKQNNIVIEISNILTIKACKEASEFIQNALSQTGHDSIGIRIALEEQYGGLLYKIKEVGQEDITKDDISTILHGLKIFVSKDILHLVNNLMMELTHLDGQTGITFVDENSCGRCDDCDGGCGKF